VRPLIAAFAVLLLLPKSSAQQKILSVCDLIIHREDYNGQIVSVRGEVGSGDGIFLDAGRGCAYKLITNGVVWPNAIWLTFPNNKSKNPLDHADFGIDWKAEKEEAGAVKLIVEREGFDANKDHIEHTFVGLFRTYLDLDKRVSPSLQIGGRAGFGDQNLFPAELIIKTRGKPIVAHGAANKKQE